MSLKFAINVCESEGVLFCHCSYLAVKAVAIEVVAFKNVRIVKAVAIEVSSIDHVGSLVAVKGMLLTLFLG